MKRSMFIPLVLASLMVVGSPFIHLTAQTTSAAAVGVCSLQKGTKCKNGACFSSTAKCLQQRITFRKRVIRFCLCEEPIEEITSTDTTTTNGTISAD